MRYRVTGEMTISVICYVEAGSEEEAREKAEEAGTKQLCWSCSSASSDAGDDIEPEWAADELDGTPKIIEVSECA